MKRTTVAVAFVAAGLCTQAFGQAQQPGAAPATRANTPTQATANKGPINDRLFLAAAGSAGMAEIALGRLALQRASSEDVKKFAQQIIDDHTKANQELMQLAAAKQIGVPRTLELRDQAVADSLGGLTGTDFDHAYMKGQVAAHMCAVALFQAAADRGQDPDIKGFASRTLPRLREHLKMARKLCPADKDDETSHEVAKPKPEDSDRPSDKK